MTPLKVACPLCRTVLMANPPFAPGQKVKCSQCGTTFALAGAHAAATTPGSSVLKSHPAATAAISGISAAPIAIRVPVAASVSPASAPEPSGKRSMLPVVGIVFGVLALAGIGLTVFYLKRSNSQEAVSQNKGSDESQDDAANQSGRPAPIQLSADDEAAAPRQRPIEPPPDQASRADAATDIVGSPIRSMTSLSAEQQRSVNGAIERGVAYLKRKQIQSGTWSKNGHLIGNAALPGLTLLECGVTPDDPVLQKAAVYARTNCSNLQATYELALAVLFLDRLGNPEDRPLIQELALRLIVGQGADGGWAYQCPVLDSAQHKEFLEMLERTRPDSPADLFKPIAEGKSVKNMDKPSQQPDSAKPKAGRKAKDKRPSASQVLQNVPALQDNLEVKSNRHGGNSDNSNSQFAILALWAAQRHRVPVERCLALVVKRYQPSQNDDGGWGYHSGGPNRMGTTPSMTCVGLLGLAVGHGLARENGTGQGSVQDPQIQKALEALSHNIGEPGNWNGETTQDNLYFLWSLERVGVLYGLRNIEEKDWYAWGAEMLVANQLKAGNWQAGGYHGSTPTLDTCFALLFLKRANLAKDLTKKIEFLKIDTRRRD